MKIHFVLSDFGAAVHTEAVVETTCSTIDVQDKDLPLEVRTYLARRRKAKPDQNIWQSMLVAFEDNWKSEDSWEPAAGDKVTYHTIGKVEHGIIKSLSLPDHAFVVYNCAGQWGDYENYTAARTPIRHLTKGWQ